MTHPDQKSAFRTRDEQVAIMDHFIRTEPNSSHLAGWIVAQLRSAEARGAAAERYRRDKSSMISPLGYLITEKSNRRVVFALKEPGAEDMQNFELDSIPVYTRPANVAALEARIAELEAENSELKKPQWFSVDGEGYETVSETLECNGAIEFEIQKISGNREVGVLWAFYDAETVHEYPSEEEAQLAARAALKCEGGE